MIRLLGTPTGHQCRSLTSIHRVTDGNFVKLRHHCRKSFFCEDCQHSAIISQFVRDEQRLHGNFSRLKKHTPCSVSPVPASQNSVHQLIKMWQARSCHSSFTLEFEYLVGGCPQDENVSLGIGDHRGILRNSGRQPQRFCVWWTRLQLRFRRAQRHRTCR